MAPMLDISGKDYERASKLLELAGIEYSIPKEEKLETSVKDNSDFIYVPSIGLHVAKERTLQNRNWYESHKELQENNERMLTIPEFSKFLNYLKNSNNQEYLEIFKDITEVKSPWRAEWLDAKFSKENKKLHINYNHELGENGILTPTKSEVLDKNTLMKDQTPGISLDSWLENPTNQGLPSKKTESGSTYYWNPREGQVAWFCAYSDGAILNCNGDPSVAYSVLGVRAVRHE